MRRGGIGNPACDPTLAGVQIGRFLNSKWHLSTFGAWGLVAPWNDLARDFANCKDVSVMDH